MIIDRKIETILRELSESYPVVTITGPRQSGKTTLCRKVFPRMAYVNLEAPDIRQFASEDPRGFLAMYPDGAILDEIQRNPLLPSYIQPLVDERQKAGQFIITGSQQFEVMEGISQSLAGRTAMLKLLPFSIEELSGNVAVPTIDRLLLTGFYPRIYDMNLDPTRAMGNYFETYVERDLRRLVNVRDLGLFEKFVRLCAGRIGQVFNLQGLANDVGVSHTTARGWLAILEASYIVFMLRPYFRNVSKRLIKSPKLYFYDTGLASYLLGLENELHVSRDPLRGNLFENLVVMEALKFRFNRGKRANMSFYRDSSGQEVDLVLEFGQNLFPIEIKAGATVTKDFFRGLRHFAKVNPELPWGNAIVYGGDTVQVRSDSKIFPATRSHELLAEIDEQASQLPALIPAP
jgi:predicted AAA+ superfamily ATPase